jgi:hypothetical protein
MGGICWGGFFYKDGAPTALGGDDEHGCGSRWRRLTREAVAAFCFEGFGSVDWAVEQGLGSGGMKKVICVLAASYLAVSTYAQGLGQVWFANKGLGIDAPVVLIGFGNGPGRALVRSC